MDENRLKRELSFLGVGVVVGIAWISFWGFTPEHGLSALGLAFIVAAALYDAVWGIVPNPLTLTGVATVLLVSFLMPTLSGLEALWGALVGGGLLFGVGVGLSWVLKKEALGGGDVKLMALIGAVVGWQSVFSVLFLSAALALIWVAFVFLLRGGPLQRAVHFGPWLGVATILAVVLK
jgi:leader peptidase (prepilin peptidase)/N-methyltransferase